MKLDDLFKDILDSMEKFNEVGIIPNTVVLNGRKFGGLGKGDTLFGMKVEANYWMPDDCDFIMLRRTKPKKTNGDRVRSMSDEELAATFSGWPSSWCTPSGEPCRYEYEGVGCDKCLRDWLKAEAEE